MLGALADHAAGLARGSHASFAKKVIQALLNPRKRVLGITCGLRRGDDDACDVADDRLDLCGDDLLDGGSWHRIPSLAVYRDIDGPQHLYRKTGLASLCTTLRHGKLVCGDVDLAQQLVVNGASGEEQLRRLNRLIGCDDAFMTLPELIPLEPEVKQLDEQLVSGGLPFGGFDRSARCGVRLLRLGDGRLCRCEPRRGRGDVLFEGGERLGRGPGGLNQSLACVARSDRLAQRGFCLLTLVLRTLDSTLDFLDHLNLLQAFVDLLGDGGRLLPQIDQLALDPVLALGCIFELADPPLDRCDLAAQLIELLRLVLPGERHRALSCEVPLALLLDEAKQDILSRTSHSWRAARRGVERSSETRGPCDCSLGDRDTLLVAERAEERMISLALEDLDHPVVCRLTSELLALRLGDIQLGLLIPQPPLSVHEAVRADGQLRLSERPDISADGLHVSDRSLA